MDFKTIIRKLLLIIPGTFIAGFGIDLAIFAGFGSGTLAVLWQGLNHTFGISLGQASLLVAAIMLLICFILDKKQIFFGTIVYQLTYSFATDFFSDKVRFSGNHYINFLIMLLGLVIYGLGTSMYAYADWGRGPYEALSFAVAKRTGFQLRYVRIAQDLLMLVIGYPLGGKVGLCSIITFLVAGPLIQFFLRQYRALEKKFF